MNAGAATPRALTALLLAAALSLGLAALGGWYLAVFLALLEGPVALVFGSYT